MNTLLTAPWMLLSGASARLLPKRNGRRAALGVPTQAPAMLRVLSVALQRCWDGMHGPKQVIAVGACAISGSPFEGSDTLDRRFLERFEPTLDLPGCPTHPLTFISGILDLLGIES